MLTIGDTQSFSGIAPITLSRGFSIETLTGVTPSWKMEYLDSCNTVIRCVARKVAAVEDKLVVISLQGCNFQMGGLVYDILSFKSRKFFLL